MTKPKTWADHTRSLDADWPPRIVADLMIRLSQAGPVAHEAAGGSKFAHLIDRGHSARRIWLKDLNTRFSERTTGRAFKSGGAQIGRPIKGGLNTVAACKSAEVRDAFLGLRLGCGSRLCRKLEHCCFLIFKQVS
jgi:hypothetical protein